MSVTVVVSCPCIPAPMLSTWSVCYIYLIELNQRKGMDFDLPVVPPRRQTLNQLHTPAGSLSKQTYSQHTTHNRPLKTEHSKQTTFITDNLHNGSVTNVVCYECGLLWTWSVPLGTWSAPLGTGPLGTWSVMKRFVLNGQQNGYKHL